MPLSVALLGEAGASALDWLTGLTAPIESNTVVVSDNVGSVRDTPKKKYRCVAAGCNQRSPRPGRYRRPYHPSPSCRRQPLIRVFREPTNRILPWRSLHEAACYVQRQPQ
jgi:hypothetical protein